MPQPGRRVLIAERESDFRDRLLRELVTRDFDVTATGVPAVALRLLRFVAVAVLGDCLADGDEPLRVGLASDERGATAIIRLAPSGERERAGEITLPRGATPGDVADAVAREFERRGHDSQEPPTA